MADVKQKKAKKPPSQARLAAIAAYDKARAQRDRAKSDQEKSVANSEVKRTRTELNTLRFNEIAPKRMDAAASVFKRLEALTNANQYGFSPAQADKVVATLERRVSKIKQLFSGNKETTDKFAF